MTICEDRHALIFVLDLRQRDRIAWTDLPRYPWSLDKGATPCKRVACAVAIDRIGTLETNPNDHDPRWDGRYAVHVPCIGQALPSGRSDGAQCEPALDESVDAFASAAAR